MPRLLVWRIARRPATHPSASDPCVTRVATRCLPRDTRGHARPFTSGSIGSISTLRSTSIRAAPRSCPESDGNSLSHIVRSPHVTATSARATPGVPRSPMSSPYMSRGAANRESWIQPWPRCLTALTAIVIALFATWVFTPATADSPAAPFLWNRRLSGVLAGRDASGSNTSAPTVDAPGVHRSVREVLLPAASLSPEALNG